MKILITGGLGFIGSHICLELLKLDNEIIILDSLVNSSRNKYITLLNLEKKFSEKFIGNVRLVEGDLRNESLLDNLFFKESKESKPINAVIHCAGLKSVGESITNPIDYWDINVSGSINLFRVMNKYNCKNLIFSSSATIYSKENNIPLKEDANFKPVNPYGSTKLTIESILEDIYYSSPKEWRICNLRYFNPIGAHDSGLIGEDPKDVPNNIFPLIQKVAAKELPKLTIYGDDWETHDGTCIRDYIHIMDLAEGHIIGLNYLLKESPQIISFNLGTGIGTSVLQLINTFEKVNKVHIPYIIGNRRKGDLPNVIADNTKSKKILNWTPKRNIEDMCKDGWKWQLNNIL